MFPYSVGLFTMLQGLYSLIWIVILMDVTSPTFDLRQLPHGTGPQVALFAAGLLPIILAIGVVMHTLSRDLFRRLKDHWEHQVLTSKTVRERLGNLESSQPVGGPSLKVVLAAEGREGHKMAGAFLQGIEYEMLGRAPELHRTIQVYRDQYRLARGAVIPSLALGLILPFWELVPDGHMGLFPLISFQLFFLGLFLGGISLHAFRERSYRCAAARLRGWVMLQSNAERNARAPGHLAAVS